MAYVVARPRGRYEVRESLHTPKGPRARSLAGFEVLTDEVLAMAAQRSTRPFDAEAVLASAGRAGAPVRTGAGIAEGVRDSSRRFVEASRRMARSMRRGPALSGREDPGIALIDLLGFADAVTRSQPPRPYEPLTFPVLARLVDGRAVAGLH
jgi:hypothetical protein